MTGADDPSSFAKLVGDIWLPKDEIHMAEWINTYKQSFDGRLAYQHHKLMATIPFIRSDRRRTAIDVGAHVGTWAMTMVRMFDRVEAFEPVELHRRIFRLNVTGPRARLHGFALGREAGHVRLSHDPTDTGDTFVNEVLPPDTAGDADMRTLDSFAFKEVDFIKIDVEGFELDVLQGGERTILDNRPLMVVEQKGREADHRGRPAGEAVRFLKSLGMTELQVITGDHIMGWPG